MDINGIMDLKKRSDRIKKLQLIAQEEMNLAMADGDEKQIEAARLKMHEIFDMSMDLAREIIQAEKSRDEELRKILNGLGKRD